jgi:DNA-binding CsgD family transcriptional regulator
MFQHDGESVKWENSYTWLVAEQGRRSPRIQKILELCCVEIVVRVKPMMLPPAIERSAQRINSQKALLVVSPDGRIQFATARAARWLKDFSFSRSERLPQALAAWLNEVISSTQPSRFIFDRSGAQLRFQAIYREPKSICLLLEQGVKPDTLGNSGGLLTQRQSEVLAWVARGKTNAEIAKILSLKTGTVGKYLERIFPKLGVENRTAAASFVLGDELHELAEISGAGATPRSVPRGSRWRSSPAEDIRPSELPNQSFRRRRKRQAICGA